MVWPIGPIRSRACWGLIFSEIKTLGPPFKQDHRHPCSSAFSTFLAGFPRKSLRSNDTNETTGETRLQSFPPKKLEGSSASNAKNFSRELETCNMEKGAKVEKEMDLFAEMKQRFLNFKRDVYMAKSEQFQHLAEAQTPKFMVIACADSRVCPSNIIGFQPGEAFMVRNVANIVPPLQNGPSETSAALEFAVNTLEVENILVIGHSCCGGIQALMSMENDVDSSSFVHGWVLNAKVAKLRTKAAADHLRFDQQCKYCEKESISHSLMNLLTYPWIKDRAKKALLSIHGGYYDFLNCSFEKWTLDINGVNNDKEKYPVRDHSLWY